MQMSEHDRSTQKVESKVEQISLVRIDVQHLVFRRVLDITTYPQN